MHDIHSPLAALDAFQYIVTSKLTDKENRILDLLKKSINDIASKLMEKYIEVKEMENKSKSRRYFNFSMPRTEKKEKEEKIDLNVSIKEVIERKEYEYSNKNVEIKYEGKVKLVFIKGDPIGFERMMSNIINNGVDAVEGKKKAEIEIICEEKGKDVEIKIKDNGTGMPKEMIEKLVAGEEIGTMKKGGHGIGTQQIIGTIQAMNGLLKIESKENVGTEFILTFPAV